MDLENITLNEVNQEVFFKIACLLYAHSYF